MANNIREIITQAVIAKGKKRTINKYSIDIGNYDQVLGCWITNHHYNAAYKENKPVVLGTFDIHLWYSYQDDSGILKQTISYLNELDLVKKDDRSFTDEDELMVSCKREPKCIGVSRLEGKVVIEVEKEIALSVVGKTTICVETKSEAESWDEIDNLNLNENFIK